MKRLVLVLLFLFLISPCFAEDRVNVQHCFRKALWQCPDGTEETTDLNVGGGNTYEHTCKNGMWTNTFKEYNGCISYPYSEYPKVKTEEITSEKTKCYNAWVYEIKHPAPYIEPTPEDIQKQIDDLEMQKQNLIQQKAQLEAKPIIK
jgi:hypothetical protein